jgi:uncharacterized protein
VKGAAVLRAYVVFLAATRWVAGLARLQSLALCAGGVRVMLCCLLAIGSAGVIPFDAVAQGQSAPASAEQVPVPQLRTWVTDQTGTLDQATLQQLEQQLVQLDKTKGAQLAVLVVPTTGSDTIESYARRVFDQWRLGRARVDDGVLLVVAKDDRRLRIEVGYGLEGAIPDILAGRIIREQITPYFKQNDYAAGIVAGVNSLVGLIQGEPLPEPPADDDGGDEPYIMLVPLAIMSFFMPPLFAGFAVGFFVGLMFESVLAGIAGGVVAALISLLGYASGKGGGRGGGGGGGRYGRRGRRAAQGFGGGFAGGLGGGSVGGGSSGSGGSAGGGGGGSGGGGSSGSW